MNKFIEYDIHNGITLIKCAIMNILDSFNESEIDSYTFGSNISICLIKDCMYDSGWYEIRGRWYSPSKKYFKFTDNINLTLKSDETD